MISSQGLYVEYGAWRGKLSRVVAEKIQQNQGDEIRDWGRFVLIDRQNLDKKVFILIFIIHNIHLFRKIKSLVNTWFVFN